MCIPADSTAKGKFFSCSWMLHMKGALLLIQSSCCPRIEVAPSLSAKVGLAALEADVVGVALHGKACRVVEPPRPLRADSLAFGQTLVLKTHQSFLSHILVKSLNGVQK